MATQALQLLLSSLHAQDANKVQILESISVEWTCLRKANIVCSDLLNGNILFLALAKVLEENFEVWKITFPSWIDNLLREFERERQKTIFLLEQTRALISALRIYVMNGSWDCLFALSCLSGSYIAKQILLEDDELYDILKKEIHRPNALRFFVGFSISTCAPAQKKVLKDTGLILSLLELLESDVEDAWKVIDNVSTHEDARALLPTHEIIRLVNKSKYKWPRLGTLLSSIDDFQDIELSSTWIGAQVQMLNSILSSGHAEHEGRDYPLSDIIVTFYRLSVKKDYEEKLAEAIIAPLLRVVIAENLPDSFSVQANLSYSRQIASEVVCELAEIKPNRTLIKKIDGIEKLKKELQRAEDFILICRIIGILDRCKANETSLEKTDAFASSKHIVISFHAIDQFIVIKIAQSLKEQGYNVQLDFKKLIPGNFFYLMTHGVENAEVVLMCLSVIYEESCRYEAEYCVQTGVPIIPLKIELGYSPDDTWLKDILRNKFFYDFCDDTNWEQKMRNLSEAIGDRGKAGTTSSLPPNVPVPPIQPPMPRTARDETDTRTQQHIKDMLSDEESQTN